MHAPLIAKWRQKKRKGRVAKEELVGGGEEEAGAEVKRGEEAKVEYGRGHGRRKRGWKEGVRELEECHNSLQIGEADGTVPDLAVYSPFSGLSERACVK